MPETDAKGQMRSSPKRIEARIPKGATDGQRLRLPGRGAPGSGKGRPGDLYLDISLRPHALFRSSGHDLYVDLPLAPWEAVLGASIEVPTLAGPVRLKVPAGTVAGRQLRLPGRGLPRPHGGAGDLFALVQITVPATVSDGERTLYEQLSQASTFDVRAAFRQGAK
jgi:curved DNA-binding protein